MLAIVRWAGLRLHASDVMVLPVLLDEVMLLLHRARTHGMAGLLQHEGPSVVATAQPLGNAHARILRGRG